MATFYWIYFLIIFLLCFMGKLKRVNNLCQLHKSIVSGLLWLIITFPFCMFFKQGRSPVLSATMLILALSVAIVHFYQRAVLPLYEYYIKKEIVTRNATLNSVFLTENSPKYLPWPRVYRLKLSCNRDALIYIGDLDSSIIDERKNHLIKKDRHLYAAELESTKVKVIFLKKSHLIIEVKRVCDQI